MKGFFVFSLVIFFIFGILFLFSVSATHNDISIFEANILGPPPTLIRVSVPDNIFFGNVSRGQESERIRIDINNTGNVDVIVTPKLVDSSEEIFNYTYFTRRVAEPYQRIGDFSFNISAPADPGGFESEYFYAKIDLRDFRGNIDRDMIGHRANVKFFAVAR